ncbi:MAG TPA: glycosyltransferase [Sedimentisphaerales bacterium]|nr:glycosyltransferase [Sedimentisphaerales bacterium]
MAKNCDAKAGPLVTVLVPTFNRPVYLAQALASVLRQSYRNLQIIVVNDGGQDVTSVIRSSNDKRLVFINRKENRGKAFSLNEALARAEGKYVAYLDDDDLYYPNHIERLVEALETQTQCQVAYSDLYKVCCRVMPDGARMVLGKVVEVSRDFDRFVLLYFNHVLHVSLMHRRDLFEKTGPYNEQLDVLIDWDMTRRLAFFSDFHHVCDITGEFYSPLGECDRISVQKRKDKNEYLRNALTIRTTRPPKPWLKIKDMSIVLLADRLDKQAAGTLGSIWRYTYHPYKLFLPVPQVDIEKLKSMVPNIVPVPVDPSASQAGRIDAALTRCDGDYIAIVPSGLDIADMWVEDSLHALGDNPVSREAIELDCSTDTLWAAVLRKSDLKHARDSFPNLPIRQSLKAAGITLRRPRPQEIPFQFDQLLEEAARTEKEGDCSKAGEIFEHIAACYQNQLWMKSLAAGAYFKAGNYTKAAELSREINRRRPTVDTLLLEAKIRREEKDFTSAIRLLQTAEQILEGE